MIIRKVSRSKNNDDDPRKPRQPADGQNMPRPKADGPRPERRRGDRRRGYRRADDRNLISRAHEEANAIREKGANEGFQYGIEKSNEYIQQLNHAITELLGARDKTMEMCLSDIAQMAVMVAEKLVKQEVATDPEIVLNVTAETIKEMGKGHKSIIIKVNPTDVAIVKENIPELYPYGDARTNIVVLDDNTVDRGSCIVETNTGIVDARFETQLAILKKAFEVGI